MIRTYDRELINSFLTQKDILPAFCHIGGHPLEYKNVYFMLGEVGLFPCVKHGETMSAHAAIPKGVRGKDAYQDGRNLIKWVFKHTDCTKLTTRADKTKKHLLHFNAKLLERTGEDNTFVYYEANK